MNEQINWNNQGHEWITLWKPQRSTSPVKEKEILEKPNAQAENTCPLPITSRIILISEVQLKSKKCHGS